MSQLKIFLLLISLFFPQTLFSTEKTVLYTVDMTKLLKSSDFGKNIISRNNLARQQLQTENDKLERKLLAEEKILSQLRTELSADEFHPKALAFDEKVTRIRAEQGEKEKDLNIKARKEETDFFKIVYPLLYELLLERGGLVLIDQRNVILRDNSVDLTNDAIDMINSVYGSRDVKKLVE